jgi:hypothetical protein
MAAVKKYSFNAQFNNNVTEDMTTEFFVEVDYKHTNKLCIKHFL